MSTPKNIPEVRFLQIPQQINDVYLSNDEPKKTLNKVNSSIDECYQNTVFKNTIKKLEIKKKLLLEERNRKIKNRQIKILNNKNNLKSEHKRDFQGLNILLIDKIATDKSIFAKNNPMIHNKNICKPPLKNIDATQEDKLKSQTVKNYIDVRILSKKEIVKCCANTSHLKNENIIKKGILVKKYRLKPNVIVLTNNKSSQSKLFSKNNVKFNDHQEKASLKTNIFRSKSESKFVPFDTNLNDNSFLLQREDQDHLSQNKKNITPEPLKYSNNIYLKGIEKQKGILNLDKNTINQDESNLSQLILKNAMNVNNKSQSSTFIQDYPLDLSKNINLEQSAIQTTDKYDKIYKMNDVINNQKSQLDDARKKYFEKLELNSTLSDNPYFKSRLPTHNQSSYSTSNYFEKKRASSTKRHKKISPLKYKEMKKACPILKSLLVGHSEIPKIDLTID